MIRCAAAALSLCTALAGCAGGSAAGSSRPPKPVADSALDGLLLDADEVNALMGATGMQAHQTVSQMADHRNLLPNLNCLGVWQVNEAPIYESSHWKSVAPTDAPRARHRRLGHPGGAIRRLLPHRGRGA